MRTTYIIQSNGSMLPWVQGSSTTTTVQNIKSVEEGSENNGMSRMFAASMVRGGRRKRVGEGNQVGLKVAGGQRSVCGSSENGAMAVGAFVISASGRVQHGLLAP